MAARSAIAGTAPPRCVAAAPAIVFTPSQPLAGTTGRKPHEHLGIRPANARWAAVGCVRAGSRRERRRAPPAGARRRRMDGTVDAVNALLTSLTEAELVLMRETEPERLAELDEDALVELHTRIRRARNKYVGVYRRQAASRVELTGGRGKSYARNSRRRAKAELFEDALARVSERLAAAARASAEILKAERLAEARDGRNTAPPAAPARRPKAQRADQQLDRQPDFTGLHKRRASTRSTGARRQARQDNR
jgi:hypothetical protein